MSGHGHDKTAETIEEPLPNQTFVSWLKSQTALFYSQFIGLAGVLYLLAALVYYLKYLSASPEIFKPENVQKFIIYAHIPFLLLFIVSLLNILDYNFSGSGRSGFVYKRIFSKELSKTQLRKGRLQLRKFKIYFLCFWISMLVLYLSFIFQINYQSAYKLPNKQEIIDNIKNANETNDSLEAVTKILQVKEWLNEDKTKETLKKLKEIKKSKNLLAAMEQIKGINVSKITAGTAALDETITAVINKLQTMDDSGQISEEIDEINKIRSQKDASKREDVSKRIEVIWRIEKIIKEFSKNDNSAKILQELREDQNVQTIYKKIGVIDEEMPGIAPSIRDANGLLNEREVLAIDIWGAIDEKKFEFFVFASNNISLLFIFWCFSILAIPWHLKKNIKKEKRLIINGTLVIFLLTFVCYPLFLLLNNEGGKYYEDKLLTYTVLTDAVSGLINAVVIAMLIARLDSKFIGLPSYLISILYGYSAVQPLFAVFEQPAIDSQIIKAFVLIAVFIFKIYFFLIITYTLQTGRMLDYLVCFPTLARRVDSLFANQFQFKFRKEGKGIGFSIKRKNTLVYSSRLDFKDEKECREGIKYYKRILKRKEAYKIREVNGTYWVDVFDINPIVVLNYADKKEICYSIPLKSRDEAKDLVNESIENIPYCKVD